MVFHPDYDAEEAGLDFLVEDGVVDESLVYCMVFVQRLSPLDDAALSLEKSGYYKHFPVDVFQFISYRQTEIKKCRINTLALKQIYFKKVRAKNFKIIWQRRIRFCQT